MSTLRSGSIYDKGTGRIQAVRTELKPDLWKLAYMSVRSLSRQVCVCVSHFNLWLYQYLSTPNARRNALLEAITHPVGTFLSCGLHSPLLQQSNLQMYELLSARNSFNAKGFLQNGLLALTLPTPTACPPYYSSSALRKPSQWRQCCQQTKGSGVSQTWMRRKRRGSWQWMGRRRLTLPCDPFSLLCPHWPLLQ